MEILFCTTPLWNESLTWNTANPEFTECFQETILVWIPTFFLLLSVPYEACMLSHRTYNPIAWNYKIISKLSLLLLLIIAQLTETIMLLATYDRSVFNFFLTQKEISSILLSITFVTVLILLILHRSKGLHTSGILFYFWLLMLLTELFRYRSSITEDFRQVEVQIFLTATRLVISPLVFAIFLLELLSMETSTSGYKYSKLNGNDYENIESPEWKASYFSQLLFWWIMPLCFKGSKQPLVSSDVYDLIDENKSNYLGQQLESILKKNYNNIGRGLFKQFGLRLFIASVICVIASLLTFANPLIMDLLMEFMNSKEELWKGIFYSVLLFAANLIRTVMNEQCVYRFIMYSIQIKSSLTVIIYRKALRLSSSAKKDWTSGEVVNLVAVDVHRIHEGLQFSFNLVSGTVFLTIATYYLFIYLGIATLAGISVLAVLIPINTGISKLVHIIQKEFLDIKDQRVKMITEVLAGMKVLKLYAWESPFEDVIIKLRSKEVHFLKKSLLVEIIMINIFIFSPFGVPKDFFLLLFLCDVFTNYTNERCVVLLAQVSLLAFITFVYSSNQILTPSVAFVSLSLFNIIKIPMGEIPFVIGELIKMMTQYKSINGKATNDVCMENGTFSWEKSSKSCLNNINLNVDQGKLIGVVGQVGSGKSSLLSAVLGEMHQQEGRVNVNGSIAYVPQQAWILNATVRENILFDSHFNGKKYQDILNKCALEADLQILAGGDLTEIGEKGINLSGGQKQRVSLARAVYNDADIYLLDDPLSAVDSHVGKYLFDNVIGHNGILHNKTRLLVTHGLKYLPNCDFVVVMKDGQISESGTYEDLMDRSKVFSELMNQYTCSSAEEENSVKIQNRKICEMSMKEEFEKGQKLDKFSVDSVNTSHEDITSTNQAGKLIEEEEVKEGNISKTVYWHYFSNVGWFYTFLLLLGFGMHIGFDLAANQWLSIWSSDYIEQNGTFNKSLNDFRVSIYAFFGGLQVLVFFIGIFSFTIGAIAATKKTHNLMLDNIMKAPMFIFDTTPIGRILNRFSRDVNAMDTTLIIETEKLILLIWRIIGSIIIICLNLPLFTIVAVIMITFYCFVVAISLRSFRQLMRLESTTRSPIYSHVQESIVGSSSIRAYKVKDIFIERMYRNIDNNVKFMVSYTVVNSWLAVILQLIGSVVVFFTAFFAVISRNVLDPAIVGLTVNYALTLTLTLYSVVRSAGLVESNIISVERVLEYTRLPTRSKLANWNIDSSKPDKSWPSSGVITFSNYQTRYRKGLDLVLKGINFDILPSEKVGIVGRTGAGKSSLTLGLFRIIESAGGQIIIDGMDISKIGLHDLRKKLTIIPQDPVLFSGTFRINLDPFDQYADDELWNALDHAHLKDFVQKQEAGLQFEVAETGQNLSVGQRQLICLARALLRHTKILILDEATAAIDLETDDLIQQTIRTEFKDCTILTIAHRLNTIMDSDRVMVLSDGNIIESGSPSDLLSMENSYFHSMAVDAGLA
ncbi:Multidrug resistance-associated protein 1 [Nymphon striatum]|nr:Multidrug resistance-associated protein 1 [Nymphon striatum]